MATMKVAELNVSDLVFCLYQTVMIYKILIFIILFHFDYYYNHQQSLTVKCVKRARHYQVLMLFIDI